MNTLVADQKQTYVPETEFGFWFLGTKVWHKNVLNIALNDLQRMLLPDKPRYPVVLDLACGQGQSLLELPARFSTERLIANDADPRSLDVAKKRVGASAIPVQWHCGDASALPAADDSVDMVFCHQTLHHIVDQKGALAEAFRVLKPGGVLLLAESTKAYIESLAIRVLFRHPMQVQRTADEYVRMVKDAGFTVSPKQVSRPYLWWSRADLGAFEFFGFPVPEKREETLVNLVAVKPA